jgi:hypothetical protein
LLPISKVLSPKFSSKPQNHLGEDRWSSGQDFNVSFRVRRNRSRRAVGFHVLLISWFVIPQFRHSTRSHKCQNWRTARLVENFLTPVPERPIINLKSEACLLLTLRSWCLRSNEIAAVLSGVWTYSCIPYTLDRPHSRPIRSSSPQPS